jgi:cytochrome c5
MKKILFILLAGGFIMTACNKKITPAVTKVEEAPPPPPISRQPKPAQPAETTFESDPSKGSRAMAVDAQKMVESGKAVYSTKCSRCHAAKNAGSYTSESWDKILQSMIPRAQLNDDEAKQVTMYVKENCKK